MSRSPATASVALISAGARVLAALALLAAGFRAVSDDDFARVVIAQRFAAAPRLDPTGTSWLPLPFWLVGSGMKVFGASLLVARVLAVVAAALSGAMVAAMASSIGLGRRRVLVASLIAATMPWAMQLAVATVPEVPAAACAAAGAMALASASPRLRILGALGLLASCLSRYDAWPTTLAFAAFTLVDATRAKGRDRALHVVAALVAVAGPLAWTLWQGVVYHDAFRYLGLVRSYRKALGTGPSLWRRVIGYPLGAVDDMREMVVAGAIGLVSWLVVRRPRDETGPTRQAPAPLDVRWGRPLALAAVQLFVLILGDVRDGAPTHHPERALLGPATIVIFASTDAFGALLSREATRWRRNVLVALAALGLVAYVPYRVAHSLPWYESAPRPREVAAGLALGAATAKGDRALVDTRDLEGGSPDYGYYALLAAFGRPLDADVDREQDPRKPRVASSFGSPEALSARVLATKARVVLAWGDDHRRVAEALGARWIAGETTGDPPRWNVLAMP